MDWITKTTEGLTEAGFLGNEVLCFAVAQKLTIIGEAATRLDSHLTRFHSTVPWPDIVGLRNILVHEYFGIYWPLVWQTVRDDTPVLRKQIAGILGQDFPE